MHRTAWRDQVIEQAIEPEIPIVDAHHHLWAVPPVPWMEVYDHDALFADIRSSGHNIIGTVLVDSHANYRKDGPEHLRVVGETENAEWVANEARRQGVGGVCAAIVSTADLLAGKRVGELLDAHIEASARFRGIRHMTAFDADFGPTYGAGEPDILKRPAFVEGLAELGQRGLSFDAWVFHHQIAELIDVARACPETTIVLNHLGGPIGVGRFAGGAVRPLEKWAAALAELARCKNVFVKIGGLNQAFTGFVSERQSRPLGSEEMAEQQRTHILTAIEQFGPERCMFESNFPADMIYTSYTVIWNCFKIVSADFTRSERADLFSHTACRAYRIEELAAKTSAMPS